MLRIGFLIEGRSDDEQPEQMLGCAVLKGEGYLNDIYIANPNPSKVRGTFISTVTYNAIAPTSCVELQRVFSRRRFFHTCSIEISTIFAEMGI